MGQKTNQFDKKQMKQLKLNKMKAYLFVGVVAVDIFFKMFPYVVGRAKRAVLLKYMNKINHYYHNNVTVWFVLIAYDTKITLDF